MGKNYKDTAWKHINNGYATKLSYEEIDKTGQRTWYLPQQPVFNEHKSNKIRIVFNAAAERDGISLNKALLTGPDLLNKLTGTLLRFINHKVATAVDIEAMYHQVRVSKSDAETLGFLYHEDLSESDHEVY